MSLLFALVCQLAPLSYAQEGDFINGFLKGYLTYRAPNGSRVKLLSISPDRKIHLSTTSCIPGDEQLQIKRDLLDSGHIRAVEWHSDACPPPAGQDDARAGMGMFANRPLWRVFGQPVAAPRTPQSSLRYGRYRTPRGSFNAGTISAGETFPVAVDHDAIVQTELALEGAVFSVFNLDGSDDLLNTDLVLGIPLSARILNTSARLRLLHQSSYLGDEFELANPNVERRHLSYEELELLVAREYGPVRLYGGGAVMVRSDPDFEPFRIQSGVEARLENIWSNMGLLMAADIQVRQELDWEIEQSYQVGLLFKKNVGQPQPEARVVIERFEGPSFSGQFFRDTISYWGLGVQLDF